MSSRSKSQNRWCHEFTVPKPPLLGKERLGHSVSWRFQVVPQSVLRARTSTLDSPHFYQTLKSSCVSLILILCLSSEVSDRGGRSWGAGGELRSTWRLPDNGNEVNCITFGEGPMPGSVTHDAGMLLQVFLITGSG